jgi:hypothetical protein
MGYPQLIALFTRTPPWAGAVVESLVFSLSRSFDSRSKHGQGSNEFSMHWGAASLMIPPGLPLRWFDKPSMEQLNLVLVGGLAYLNQTVEHGAVTMAWSCPIV